MANSILDAHYPTTSNSILVSHGWPSGASANSVLASHDGDYPALGGGGTPLTHGSEFTITGSGFGTRAAKPLVYDNFESGTVGANVAGNAPVYREIGASWVWSDSYGTTPSYPPKYSNDVTRGLGTRVMRAQYGQPDAYKSGLLINHPLPNSGDAVYFSMWLYYDHTSTDWPDNLKPWDAFDADYLYPAAYFGWGQADVDVGEGRSALQDADQDGDPDSPTLWDSTGIANLRDVEVDVA